MHQQKVKVFPAKKKKKAAATAFCCSDFERIQILKLRLFKTFTIHVFLPGKLIDFSSTLASSAPLLSKELKSWMEEV